jgi:sulfate transport system substrate-binding protein
VLTALCLVFGFVALLVEHAESAADTPQTVHLALVAYSTPRDAFGAVIKAFQATPQGHDVVVDESYGGSGEQSRAVLAGLPADIVAFSLEPDVTRLVQGGLVGQDWRQTKTHGMVTRSVVVFIVRKGNPKHIGDWNDLVKPQVDVITPNPFTSGGARWNIAAAYGAQLKQGKTQDQAAAYLRTLFSHISVQDKSAREALQTFVGGKGDVMIAYESEAILAQRKELAVDYLIPPSTILIENPIAVTSSSQHPAQARALVDFFLSSAGQRILASHGYRPVNPDASNGQTKAATLFTIASLGGWTNVDQRLFDADTGVVAKIEQDLGLGSAGR